jgi:hypothetical protein
MNIDEFVHKLAECAPSAKSLEEAGLSESEIAEIHAAYKIEPIEHPRDTDYSALGYLAGLFSRFDLSTVEIGLVQFREPEELNKFDKELVIGNYEADLLTVNT